MDKEQRIAFINSQVVCATAAIEGMKAENSDRLSKGYSIAYDDEAFCKVPAEFGLEHNQVIEYLRDS